MTKESKVLNNNLDKKIAKMPYEEAVNRLEEVVESLSSKQVNLDKMIELYEEGKLLHQHCSKLLESAKLKIEEVKSY